MKIPVDAEGRFILGGPVAITPCAPVRMEEIYPTPTLASVKEDEENATMSPEAWGKKWREEAEARAAEQLARVEQSNPVPMPAAKSGEVPYGTLTPSRTR